jgi:hypothetical protein
VNVFLADFADFAMITFLLTFTQVKSIFTFLKKIKVMSRKSILYISFFLLINTSLFGQNGVYSITEKMSNFQIGGGTVFDTVFVTNPNGTVTTYDIPHFTQDVSGHNSQLMTIINSITNLGYKIIESEGWNYPFYVYDTPTSAHYLRTMFLGIP